MQKAACERGGAIASLDACFAALRLFAESCVAGCALALRTRQPFCPRKFFFCAQPHRATRLGRRKFRAPPPLWGWLQSIAVGAARLIGWPMQIGPSGRSLATATPPKNLPMVRVPHSLFAGNGWMFLCSTVPARAALTAAPVRCRVFWRAWTRRGPDQRCAIRRHWRLPRDRRSRRPSGHLRIV